MWLLLTAVATTAAALATTGDRRALGSDSVVKVNLETSWLPWRLPTRQSICR